MVIKIFIVLLFGVAGFAALKLLGMIALRLPNQYGFLKRVSRYLPLVELSFWTVYVFWVNDYLFGDKSYHDYLVISLVTVVLILISWFWLKDFIAGIILKVQHQLKRGQHISVNELGGKIIRIRMTYITIETDEGQKINIPYTKVSQGVIRENIKTETQDRFSFHIKIDASIPKEEFISKAREIIFNSPWSIFQKTPQIELVEENDDNKKFEIKLQAFNARHVSYIEARIRRILGEMVV